jgi:hypothetical protein
MRVGPDKQEAQYHNDVKLLSYENKQEQVAGALQARWMPIPSVDSNRQ